MDFSELWLHHNGYKMSQIPVQIADRGIIAWIILFHQQPILLVLKVMAFFLFGFSLYFSGPCAH